MPTPRLRAKPGLYPLLLTGTGVVEYLSVADCALVAHALDRLQVDDSDGGDDVRRRVRQLAAQFRRGV